MGVWSTEESCYRFIAEHCPPGTRTLETGSGLSTVLLAALGAEHICCTGGQEEADRVIAYCDVPRHRDRHAALRDRFVAPDPAPARSEPASSATSCSSTAATPSRCPCVDWFYGATLLPANGVLVVDDVDLPAVRILVRFLDQDPRWTSMAGSPKWRAWRRARRRHPLRGLDRAALLPSSAATGSAAWRGRCPARSVTSWPSAAAERSAAGRLRGSGAGARKSPRTRPRTNASDVAGPNQSAFGLAVSPEHRLVAGTGAGPCAPIAGERAAGRLRGRRRLLASTRAGCGGSRAAIAPVEVVRRAARRRCAPPTRPPGGGGRDRAPRRAGGRPGPSRSSNPPMATTADRRTAMAAPLA